jgi:hypothetical protein
VRDGLIVAKATTACGFWTVRVGKRNSARSALAANRATALGGVGLRGIGSSRAVASIDCAFAVPTPTVKAKMPTLAIPIRARFIIDSLLDNERGSRQRPRDEAQPIGLN